MKLLLNLRLTLILLVLSVGLLVVDSHTSVFNIPKSLIQHITVPLQYGFYKIGVGVSSQFAVVTNAHSAAQQNQALRKQYADILAENADLRRKLSEANALVDQQNSLSPKTFDLLAARPIGLGRFLTIDKGSDDGLQVGEAVVFKNQYLGQIKQLFPRSAQVLMATDPDSKIAVFAQNTNGRARGILEGQFGSESLMNKILHEEPISPDDLIYSEGTEGRLPKGLIMGKVSRVFERPNEVFKQAQAKPVFNPLDLDIVFIIRN